MNMTSSHYKMAARSIFYPCLTLWVIVAGMAFAFPRYIEIWEPMGKPALPTLLNFLMSFSALITKTQPFFFPVLVLLTISSLLCFRRSVHLKSETTMPTSPMQADVVLKA
jgi:type II secretory pathway component PulF